MLKEPSREQRPSTAPLLVSRAEGRSSAAAEPASQHGAQQPAIASRAGQIRGTVRAHDGSVLALATVCEIAAGGGSVARCVTTEASGRFLLTNVLPDTTGLLASAQGYRSRLQPLQPAAAREDELVLELLPGGEELSGEVRDATGGPVGGAAVSLRSSTAAIVGATLSNADGSFTLQAAAADLELCAQAEAYCRACRDVAVPSQGHVLLLTPESKLVGQVRMRGSGEPVAGASVSASNANGLQISPRTAVSAQDGSFVIDALPAGGYLLVAASSTARSTEQWAAIGLGETSGSLTLWADAAVRVSGVVLLGGEPCPGGVVDLSGPVWARGHIMAGGAFRIDGVVPGQYLAVGHCGAVSQGVSLEVGSEAMEQNWSLEKRLEVAAEEQASSQRSQRPGTGALRVTLEGGLEGVLGVFAQRTDGEWFRGKRVSESFAFEGLPEGEYLVRVNDYFEQAQPVRITHDGEPAQVRLSSAAPGWILGRVLSDTGLPVADAWVGYSRSDVPSVGAPAQVLTDEQGGFRVPAAPGVRYGLLISSPSGDARLDGVRVDVDSPGKELLVRVSSPASLSGKVQTARGEPVADFTLTYRRTDDPGQGELRGAHSAFHLPRLQPGTYSLQVSSPLGSAAQEIQLEASKSSTMTMTLDSSERTATN